MTSMFDQYNKTLKREEHPPDISSYNEPKNTGYVSVRIRSEEQPIFSKQKMKLNLPHDILFMTVCNNWLVTLMSHQVILRLFLLQPDRQDEVYMEKYLAGLKVSNLFLDPLGNHLLISLTPKSTGFSPELLYLNRKTNKPKKIEKFKDHEVTAVAFNYENKLDSTTGSILIGTSRGLIFETEFGVDGDKVQNNWKQVFDVGKGEHCPITGIEFHKVPKTTRYIILVTTLDRLYKFQEELRVEEKSPYLQNIFNSYLSVPEHIRDFHEIPNKLKYSKLRFNYDAATKYPKYFGWLTDPGIFSGEIDPIAESHQFIISNEIIPFPTNAEASTAITSESYVAKKSIYPTSFVLTDFHVLLLYTDHITAVSLLNYQTIYEEYFTEQYGRLLDLVKDTANDTIYAYTSKSIFRYKVHNEQRNVWRMYLDKNEFELAQKYSQDNPAHLDIVLVKQAELFFQQRDYMKSAVIYSKTQSSFEGVCLKFLEINEKEALMTFLRNRLEQLPAQDKTQITMLVVWMVELYLTEMAHNVDNQKVVLQLQKEFDNFMNLPRVEECSRSNRSVIYDLLASHGDNFNLTSLTTVNKDYESVVNQHINQSNFSRALATLTDQNKTELYYKYCPILMEEIPKETTSAIIALGKRLDPVKLLPTLVSIDGDEHVGEVIRYLEFCIHSMGCTELAIHNFLVKLYGRDRPDKLMNYLKIQGEDITMVHYDVHYALRVCREHDVKEACVFLQCLLEQWHPAVELALSFNTALAQSTASRPVERDIRRKLWLRIAEHEIKGKDDVKQALELLKDCDLLRIEDLLPFFSDFEKIDHFKEAICDALKEYNLKIQEQRKDMEESAKSAERVRSDFQMFRNRSVVIGSDEQCAICSVYLLLKPFFVFPCGHKFHGDCLETELTRHLSPDEARKLSLLKQQLAGTQAQTDTASLNGTKMSSRDQLKAEIETILGSDCLFCGEIMVNSIDKPFINDWDKVNSDWQ